MKLLLVSNDRIHAKIFLKKMNQICIRNNIQMDMEISTSLEYKKADIILLAPQLAYAKTDFKKRYPQGILIPIQHYEYASLQPKQVVRNICHLIYNR